MNLEGRILGNRYEIIEKIGNGGMATVYKAKCHILKREVAVKILRDEFTTDNEFIKRFNIEAQSVASLTHPNIVSIYDVGHEGNLYYIVMELVKGKTLKDIIVEEGKLPWKWSVKIAVQIASALEKAHKNNIIHRDIKPHNIIITEEGVAKVADFGIAKAVSNSTITAFGATIGSVHYFSPEHAKGGFTDAKSDLYSLGVVLYEMITGKVPFDADTPVSVALKHMQEEPVEPIILNSTVPVRLNKIILKAMQKDANLRYASATEMMADLEAVLKNPSATVLDSNQDTFATQRVSINYEDKKEKANENDKKGKFAKIKKFFNEHKALKVISIILALILVFVLSMVGTFWALSSGGDKTKEVQIPDLRGLTVEQAKAEASNLGLTIKELEPKFDVEIPEGQIISQEPKYQNPYNVNVGSEIGVTVSKGQELVKVPKLVGETRDDANRMLRELGFVPEFKEEYNDEVEKGYIVKQDIAEDEEILAGSKITLEVSAGIEQFEVPNLIGMSEEDAKKAILDANLKWKSTVKISDSSKPNGQVVDQNVSAESVVDKGTEITITVNEFNETKIAKLIIKNISELTKYEPEYNIEDIIDETTGEVTKKETLKPAGNVRVVVYIDGESTPTIDTSVPRNNKDDVEVGEFYGKDSVTVKVELTWEGGSRKITKDFNFNSGVNLEVQ